MLSQLFVRVICQTFVSSSKYTNTAMHEDTGEKTDLHVENWFSEP